jgi:uncharacterized YigZ family protein
MLSDTYTTLDAASIGEFKDKGSRFLAFAFPISSEEEVKPHLLELKKAHHAAAHFCYAYVLGNNGNIHKSNDDREPANSAGKPILRAILSSGVTNTLVVVVRYFGGKLLGVSGLIQAYGNAAKLSLSSATLVEFVIMERFKVTGNFNDENELYKVYKQFDANIINHTYNQSEFVSIFEVRKNKSTEILNNLKNKRLFDIDLLKET